MAKETLKKVEDSTAELLQLISSFSQDQMNVIPFEGSWTAGQVAEHILKSDKGMVKALQGAVKPTERAPDQGVGKLEEIFLNFDTKLKSPDFIIPSNGPHDKEELLSSLKKTRMQIIEVVKTKDLTETCLDSPKPLGELTRLEIITFVHVHTQRHIHQLKKILQKVAK